MAKNWHDKHDIEERFGWSFRQLKTRLTYLNVVMSNHYQGGNGQAYRVDDDGLAILDRQHQLEKDGSNVKEASRKVISELGNVEGNGKKDNVKVSKGNEKDLISEKNKRIQDLQERVEELRQDKRRLEDKVDNLEQRLLTGETEDSKSDTLREELHEKELELEKMKMEVERKKSPLQRFWQWLGL